MAAEARPALRLERVFAASPDLVWDAWTDPAQYAKWLNPAPGHDLVIREYDVRPGGRIDFDMPQPDGSKNPQTGVFHVVDPKRELVSGEPDRSFLVRALFLPEGKGTRLVVEITGLPPEWREPATAGWNACFDKLQAVLVKTQVRATGADLEASAKGFTVERTFRAPPERVWAMWTTKDGLMRWWAPSAEAMGYRFTVQRLDVRVGGGFAFEMANDAHALVNRGTYRVVRPHADLAWTWHYDIFLQPGEKPYDVPIDVAFEAVPEGTRMTFRQGPLASPEYTEGSRQGVVANLDRLAKALEA